MDARAAQAGRGGHDDGDGEPVEIVADSARLAGRLFGPSGRAAVATVVLHGASGIPQRFYRAFAAWLAERHGASVLTYDTATSAPRRPAPCGARPRR